MVDTTGVANPFGDSELLLKAITMAVRVRRPTYLIKSEIVMDRPKSGPYTIAWPNGSTTASGLGRKRIRRKKTKITEQTEEE